MYKQKPQIIAFHLPQYHITEENNKWWGDGFTEWTNVKKAKPLFDGHNQPRVPLNNNYYDMTDISTLKWQAKLAADYNIYGFCYYHYWFKGKLLLNKPLELLLSHKEINEKYCLCWANETWARTWDGREKDILIQQDYGQKDDWLKHIQYLDKFFDDERYIKINNQPVLVIYKACLIENINNMVSLWQDYRLNSGKTKIRIIEEYNGIQNQEHCTISEGHILFEPSYTGLEQKKEKSKIMNFTDRCRLAMKKLPIINRFNIKFFMSIVDYDKVWNRILKRKINSNETVYLGAFIDWDNSPRKGKDANIYSGVTVEKFKNYFKELIKKSENEAKTEFIFINAWNEWAEGTYLEPDEKNGYAYLESIRDIVNNL